MKNNPLLIIAIFMLTNCNLSISEQQSNPIDNSIHPPDLFSLSDAEKILGQQASLTDNTSTINENVSTNNRAYTANSKDETEGKTGNVYFMFEQYKDVASAVKAFASIKTSNENKGIKILDDLGDEAYFHSDGQNFYFILIRKGEKMFRVKVNKITNKTSLEEFNLLAKNITNKL